MLNIEPIKKEKSSDLVIKALLNLLNSGELKDGDTLGSESKLASLLCVSRPILRESLSTMQGMGLIQIQNGKRTIVKKNFINNTLKQAISLYNISDSDVLEIIEVRKTIETRVVELAVEAATKDDINTLQEILKKMKSCRPDNGDFTKYDMKYHITIAEISRNSLYLSLIKTLYEMIKETFNFLVHIEDSEERALFYHQQIFNAFVSKNPKDAMKAMHNHLLDTKKHYLKWISKKKSEAGKDKH